MFGSVPGGLTFTKVLSGISKTLGIANQVIPLYKEAKPMINNAKTILSVLKSMNGKDNKSNNSNIIKENKKTTNTVNNINSNFNNNINSPKFFL